MVSKLRMEPQALGGSGERQDINSADNMQAYLDLEAKLHELIAFISNP